MKTRTISRLGTATLAVAVVLGVMVGVLPAFASHTPTGSTASVNVREVLARTTNQSFAVTVAHDTGVAANPITGEGATPAINWVVLQTAGGYSWTSITPPSGWSFTKLNAVSARFTGGTIAAGSNATFTFVTDNTNIPSADRFGTWSGFVSSDAGTTSVEIRETSAGVLKTNTRVLKAESLRLTAPAGDGVFFTGAVDNSVTQGQTGVSGACTIRNLGAAALLVTPTVSGGFTTTSGPTPGSVPANTPADFPFTADFSNTPANPSTSTCGGSAPGASIITQFQANLNVNIQAKPALGAVANTLTPKASPPGAIVAFKLQATQTAGNSPKVKLNAASTCLEFDTGAEGGAGLYKSCLTADVVSSPGVTSLLEFQAKAIPPLPAGKAVVKVTPKLTFVGVDDNTVVFTPAAGNLADQFRIDFGVPQVLPGLTAPASNVSGQSAAVRQEGGDNAAFGGTVKDTDENGLLSLCGAPDCTIEQAELRQYDANDSDLNKPITVTPSNAGGNISGGYTGAFDPATRKVRLYIKVRDAAGNVSDGLSDAIEVDALKPTIAKAITSIESLTSKPRNVKVTFNKNLKGQCSPNDWSVAGNPTLACTSSPDAQNPVTDVTLTFANEFPKDFTTPVVLRYEKAQTSTAYQDRVRRDLPSPLDTTILDGLAPALPNIDTVTTGDAKKFGVQGDGFYTNQKSPTFALSGTDAIDTNYTGEIWKETNGVEGLQRADAGGVSKDTRLGRQTATQDNAVDVPSTLFPEGNPVDPAEIRMTVYAVTLDFADNVSPVAIASLVYDTIVPKISAVRAESSKVVLTFGEALARGRNVTEDWRIQMQGDENDPEGRLLFGSAISGSGTVREIAMNSQYYDRERISHIEFAFFGPSADRYEDRAGNQMLDFRVCDADSAALCAPGSPPILVV